MKDEGNQQDYGMQGYDPRLGSFLSVDPLTREYPFYTPYQFAGNRPIMAIDLDGVEELPMVEKFDPHTEPFPVIAAIDNGAINALNNVIGLWNEVVQTVRSLNRGTYTEDLKAELKKTWSGLKSTANHVANKPFSPLTVELLTTVYLFSKRSILEANHTPTMKSLDIAGFKISYNEGSAFQMPYEEHRAFISTGSSKAAQAFQCSRGKPFKAR